MYLMLPEKQPKNNPVIGPTAGFSFGFFSKLASGCPSGNSGINAKFNVDVKFESVGGSQGYLDGPGCPETPQNHLLNHPKQLLIQQQTQKFNPWSYLGFGHPGTFWRLQL